MTFPSFQPVSPLVDLTYQSILIDSTQQAVEIAEAIESATIAGKIKSGLSHMTKYPDGSMGWIVQITVGAKLFTAYQFDWLVLDSEGALSTWHGGSLWPGINPEYADQFPVPPVVWAATTTAPAAAAAPGWTATLAFPQPTSWNFPFTYTVAQTISGVTSDATVTGQTVDADGNVTLTVADLTEGEQPTFVVTVHTPYEGVSATSVATAPITATA
jgi:hypothetical protein